MTRVAGDRPAGGLGDTWVLAGGRWLTGRFARSRPRCGHAMAYGPARRWTLLFGGGSYRGTVATSFDDTWSWDRSRWTRLDSSQPATR